jgi:hypothetical protein
VLRRIRESSPEESILLVIFAGEREELDSGQRIESDSDHESQKKVGENALET